MRIPWPNYSWRQLQGDCFGGAIAALIALPYGLAMASLMGLPPVLGLVTSVLTAPFTALLGRNPILIGGTSTVTVPFIGAAVAAQGLGGAAKVTIIAAIFMMVFCVLRLGRHITRVPASVVSGFSVGIGAMMLISQLKTIFGLPKPAGGWAETMAGQLMQVILQMRHTRLTPAVLAIVVMVVATLVSRWSKRAPAPLLGVGVASLLAWFGGWKAHEVGRLPLEIPPFVSFSWTPEDVVGVLPSAFGLAVVASANLLITSRVAYHFMGSSVSWKRADADTELGAYGIANLVAGIFGAPMSVGIPARSLANVRCGGTTRLSNLLHAVFLAVFLALGAEVVSHIPIPALAGVTAWVGICLLDWSTWRRLPRMRRQDASAFLCTALSVQIVNPVAAVMLGCSFYALPYLYTQIGRSRTGALPMPDLG